MSSFLQHEPFNSIWKKILLPGNSTNGIHFDHSLLNLTDNTSYSVRIRARNNLGWSKLSDEIMFNTTDKSKFSIYLITSICVKFRSNSMFLYFLGFFDSIIWEDINGVNVKTADIFVLIVSILMLICN